MLLPLLGVAVVKILLDCIATSTNTTVVYRVVTRIIIALILLNLLPLATSCMQYQIINGTRVTSVPSGYGFGIPIVHCDPLA